MAEIIRQKNVATTVSFPLIDSSDHVSYYSTSAWGNLTSTLVSAYSWTDSSAVPTSLTVTGTPTRMGSSGIWSFAFTSAEMYPNTGTDDYISLTLKASQIDPQTLLIHLVNYDYNEIGSTINSINAKTSALTFSGTNVNANILQTSADGVALSTIFEKVLSYCAGKISKTDDNTYVYKKADGSTTSYTMSATSTSREII